MIVISTQTQGALYRSRRRRLSRLILQSLTPWSSGLSVSAGQYVSSENATSAWVAQSSGTTGASEPTGQGSFNDGGVTWTLADIPSLLAFLYAGAPTPA